MKEIQGTYRQATGELPFRLTNDYLFRALLQKNNKVLKHLTCSLMRIRPEEVKEVRVENPIVLGEAVRDKEFILDVKVSLNSEEIINYEMQSTDTSSPTLFRSKITIFIQPFPFCQPEPCPTALLPVPSWSPV